MVSQNRHPIIYNIALSYERFSSEYYNIGKNYMKAYIFKNKLFKRGNRDNNVLCENFFGRNNDFQYAKIARIRLEDLLIGRQMKSLDEINNSLDVNFTLAIYMRLSGAVHFFLEKKINDPPCIPVGNLQFVTSYSKGSQKIRRVLVAKNVESGRPPVCPTPETLSGGLSAGRGWGEGGSIPAPPPSPFLAE